MMKKLVINTITAVIVNSMKKIVVFDNITGRFIKNKNAYPGPKELRCMTPAEAHDFKTVQRARSWAEKSGWQSLSVLTLMP